ncbi:putative peptidase C1-like protein F26E4.3 [Chionoecetes opilio]|uniref:Putative peptidase C1-like protein F26E4.3 n=1 Tax=Chionoecetes opilio TaxID=41210 RepID=A0A8J4Y278_CHIOP|nr:putative peptidase C1-like protein F26E4.3 [Chionoecetes opilio]
MATRGLATLVVVVAVAVIGAEALSPPKQNYCKNRKPSECCRDGRDDDCTVPIRDTFCYCDDFCIDHDERKGVDDDCCPDFRETRSTLSPSRVPRCNKLCASLPPPAVCIHEGKALQNGTYTFNCNKCTCLGGRMDCEDDQCLVDRDLIREVNHVRIGWTATNYSTFWGKKAKEGIAQRTGTLLSNDRTRAMLPILLHPDPRQIPRDFDARLKGEWRGLISGVRDQGWCGASWIFSTLDVAQDRQMILSRGAPVSLAPQQLLSCALKTGDCRGGYVDHAWMYLRKLGVVEESCYPYVSGAYGGVPPCQRSPRFSACKVFKMEPAYRIANKEEDIQWEIMTNGPVQALMTVHRHLFTYGSGVYSCPKTDTRSTQETGMHSVRILGWGEETFGYPPKKYWLVANSWGTEWGENGLFRIQRGNDASCGIEDFVLAVRGRRDHWAKKTSQFEFQRR